MTQEEKGLLLKDLCARLPYGINVKIEGERYFNEVKEPYIKEIHLGDYLFEEDDITIIPYLRPMSSMTEEEKIEYNSYHSHPDNIGDSPWFYVDWLNEHHFDMRNLIEKGLAIDCTGLNIY